MSEVILTGEQLIALAKELPPNITVMVKVHDTDLDRLEETLIGIMSPHGFIFELGDDLKIPHVWLLQATGKFLDNIEIEFDKKEETKTTWAAMLSSRRKRTNGL